jgi:hypothetical protein
MCSGFGCKVTLTTDIKNGTDIDNKKQKTTNGVKYLSLTLK